ncbi:MAG: 16S rRNA (uracil(1498)-N(3))-methyltransferase [Treponema sp.]|jgi:16S rRNA (uracil1498-N3)-methyltransferase|nr:16S rRNA (uracil(1498)-N(3))-methyltransferase [Treponema sp.]
MKQFILNETPDPGGRIRISGEDYHYLVHVRRFAPGSVFTALLPGGGQVRIRVLAVDKRCLIGECGALPPSGEIPPSADIQRPVQAEFRAAKAQLPPIYLFQALPKGVKMDLIVRQAAEGGVAGIVPFVSDHGVSRLAPERAEERLARWRRIIKEARQQSGSEAATQIEAPRDVDGLLARWEELRSRRPRAVGLLFHQDTLEQGCFHGYLDRDPDLAAALIGPEGGFSPEELTRFKAAGFMPLVMGDTVLRVETAAVYATAAIRIILWERMSWMLKTPR